MWPILGYLFWGTWVVWVLTEMFVAQHNERELAHLRVEPNGEHIRLTGKATIWGKRVYLRSDYAYYFVTFKRPGALPLELEVDESCFTQARRGDRGDLTLVDGWFSGFHGAA